MTRQNSDPIDGQYQKQSRGDRKQDSRSGRRMAGDGDGEDQLTGAGQRPGSGYPEQNPRPGQHQTGGGIDKGEVGDDLYGDLESDDLDGDDQDEEDGYQKDPVVDQPQTGDDVVPVRVGTKSIKGLGREQIERKRSGKELIDR